MNLNNTCISEAANQARISERWSYKKLIFDDEGKFPHYFQYFAYHTFLLQQRPFLQRKSVTIRSSVKNTAKGNRGKVTGEFG